MQGSGSARSYNSCVSARQTKRLELYLEFFNCKRKPCYF